jgi:hypothetical protein
LQKLQNIIFGTGIVLNPDFGGPLIRKKLLNHSPLHLLFGERTLYFQVAVTVADEPVYEREFGAFSTIDDNYEKFVVTIDDIRFPSYKGIRHIRAWELAEVL